MLNSTAGRGSESNTEFGLTSWNKSGPVGRSKIKSSDSGVQSSGTTLPPQLLQHPLLQCHQVPGSSRSWVLPTMHWPALALRPGTMVCKAFNEGSCTNAAAHPSKLHVCNNCLAMVDRTFPHQDINVNRKQVPPESVILGYAALKDISLDNHITTRTAHEYSFRYDFCSALVAPASGVRGCRWGSLVTTICTDLDSLASLAWVKGGCL